jgi:hypothetical protein
MQGFQTHMGQVGQEMKKLRMKIKEEEIKKRRDTELINL